MNALSTTDTLLAQVEVAEVDETAVVSQSELSEVRKEIEQLKAQLAEAKALAAKPARIAAVVKAVLATGGDIKKYGKYGLVKFAPDGVTEISRMYFNPQQLREALTGLKAIVDPADLVAPAPKKA